ncbi:hypothetical protein LBMAG10_10750 [Actinomycetes bacterium]|nr:hypothetical protein LBMAG10_10750 [Actinomycetes bacterium]
MGARETILESIAEHKLEFEEPIKNTIIVTLPGIKKLHTYCVLIIGQHSLSINAFVIRKPDQNQSQIHEWLLHKNINLYALSYAVNELGDIYLVGRLPLSSITSSELDRIFGAVLEYCDTTFNTLLEMGFADAIRREWAWRLSRGESMENLKAFAHLVEVER